MYRSAASAFLVLACAATAAGATGPAPALPPDLALATMRPTVHGDDGGLREVSLRPDGPAPLSANLAARLAAAPTLIARVDVGDQTMTVSVRGERLHTWKVSTGAKGYRTPRGSWSPYRMHTMWHSRKYDNAPMPHSIFFTGGYAIHATPHLRRLGRPASHGCVRLHPDHARELFALVKEHGRANMRVVVQD